MGDLDSNALFQKGLALVESGEWDLARQIFEKLAEKEPGEPYCYLYLGISYLNTDRIAEAEQSFRTAIMIDPENGGGYFFLASLLLERNNDPDMLNMEPVDEAIEHLRKAVELYPGFADAYYKLGVAFACIGSTEPAIAAFQKALILEPDMTDAKAGLAQIQGLKN